jgi:hypothetical protein
MHPIVNLRPSLFCDSLYTKHEKESEIMKLLRRYRVIIIEIKMKDTFFQIIRKLIS